MRRRLVWCEVLAHRNMCSTAGYSCVGGTNADVILDILIWADILIRIQVCSTAFRTFTSSSFSTTTSSLCPPSVSLSFPSIHPPLFPRAGRSPHAHPHVRPPLPRETSPISNGLLQPLRENIATVSQPYPVNLVHSATSRRCLQYLR